MSALRTTGRMLNTYIRLQHPAMVRVTGSMLNNKILQSNQRCGLQTVMSGREHGYPVCSNCGRLKSNVPHTGIQTSRRGLWGWLNAIFNRVDESRIKEVGPDRACAEWLLRCGAFVKWQNREAWTTDYNSLPPAGGRSLKIEEVDATDSAIMHIGFPHFRGCKHIRRMVFHKASYLDDTGLSQLPLVRATLTHLQISSCGNVTMDGLRHIKKLENLQYLLLYDLPEIKNKEEVVKELGAALPNCEISFPYAQPEDDPNLQTKKE